MIDLAQELEPLDARMEDWRTRNDLLTEEFKEIWAAREAKLVSLLAEMSDKDLLSSPQTRVLLCREASSFLPANDRLRKLTAFKTREFSHENFYAGDDHEFFALPVPRIRFKGENSVSFKKMASEMVTWVELWALGRPIVKIDIMSDQLSRRDSYYIEYDTSTRQARIASAFGRFPRGKSDSEWNSLEYVLELTWNYFNAGSEEI